MSIMKRRSLFLTLFCCICFSVSAQVDSFQQNIIEYLNNNGTESQYNEAYDQMFVVLNRQFVDVPEEVWNEIKKGKDKSVQDVIEFLTFAYRKHFTEAEIIKMETFYKTETARKLVLGTNDLTNEDNDKIMEFFESEIGKKIEAKRQDLSVDIAEISSHWSRDLFGEKMSLLVKKGYTTKH